MYVHDCVSKKILTNKITSKTMVMFKFSLKLTGKFYRVILAFLEKKCGKISEGNFNFDPTVRHFPYHFLKMESEDITF